MSNNAKSLKVAIILVTSLFFLWGLSYGLLDVMNKNFQNHLGITKANSGLLQTAYFGAYFIIAIPASIVARKYSYKVGIIMGLALYAIGALLIIPASNHSNFQFFLLAFFVLACGLGSLETNANPYITKLGDESHSAFRINMAQSFNGVGQFIGPILGGQLFLSLSHDDINGNMANIQMVYVGIAVIVFLVLLAFVITKMPDGKEDTDEVKVEDDAIDLPLYKVRHYVLGVIAQCLYVSAQISAGAFFINYSVSHWDGLSDASAATFFSFALIAFMLGRIVTTPFMTKFSPSKILGIYSVINCILILLMFVGIDKVSIFIAIGLFFFMSISFPTIFSLSLVKLSADKVKTASSIIIMTIGGGAILPFIMGTIADHSSIAASFLILFPCFLYVAWYGFSGCKVVCK